ncbi:radical SAM/SPASM domain-containing protein [Clostridium perfringens]|uniref:Radical SAM domain-containing protein n=1 Tax=Clostridium perfringens TaxID=1502 RepID=A0A2X3IPE8_CLOPF|nr:radical SAM protein [Clostridium perfringens]AMN30882.1 hypothetical protein JFP55_pJ0023 [Clostridium perfringens]ELC8420358.1 4Fe-4S cluster-binding domain-containing protein [Clostridium perfringens]ELC8440671.1 4Fe-4S cluster-binding domain-containing protein [Clostridium perfringens]ELC8460659.1 4Fe-4S cluster-binding domain-containing protein [Clostridium perfringens]MDG6893953.1 hypothetical protein [Clostridium perfringens]
MKKSMYNIYIQGKNETAIFNLLTRNIIVISNDEYLNFDKLINDEECKEELKSMGFSLENNINEIELMKCTLNKGKFSEKSMTLFLSLTRQCNLNCSYCYQDKRKMMDKENSFLNKNDWFKIFEFLKKKSVNLNELHITLFGGEPLLNKSIILQIIDDLNSLKNRNLKIYINLITNGVLLDKDFCEKIYKSINYIQITLDGNKSTHNKVKVFPDGSGSFDIIYNNLREIINLFENKIELRINVNEEIILNCFSLFKRLRKDSLNKSIAVNLHPIFENQSSFEYGCNKNTDNSLILKINDLYYYLSKNNFKFRKNFIEGPCIAKHINSFAIDENLNIYKCPGFLYSKSNGFINDIGEVNFLNSDFFKEVNSEQECIKSCLYAPICYGGCTWQNKCNKKLLDLTLKPQLKAYLISRYNFEV